MVHTDDYFCDITARNMWKRLTNYVADSYTGVFEAIVGSAVCLCLHNLSTCFKMLSRLQACREWAVSSVPIPESGHFMSSNTWWNCRMPPLYLLQEYFIRLLFMIWEKPSVIIYDNEWEEIKALKKNHMNYNTEKSHKAQRLYKIIWPAPWQLSWDTTCTRIKQEQKWKQNSHTDWKSLVLSLVVGSRGPGWAGQLDTHHTERPDSRPGRVRLVIAPGICTE